MARGMRLGWAVALGTAGAAGCATAPPVDNPVLVRRAVDDVENPVLVSPGVPTGVSYREVFEKCIDVADDYFDILAADPYAGQIITRPRVAPGYEQVWRAGNPDPRSRLMATFQTIRQTAVITIRTGERGGYLVYVVVEKEQEDIPRPTRVTTGAVFQEAPTVDRRFEVVGPVPVSASGTNWFPIGRDYALEQQLLQRIRECK
jgi:hypothetical protein